MCVAQFCSLMQHMICTPDVFTLACDTKGTRPGTEEETEWKKVNKSRLQSLRYSHTMLATTICTPDVFKLASDTKGTRPGTEEEAEWAEVSELGLSSVPRLSGAASFCPAALPLGNRRPANPS